MISSELEDWLNAHDNMERDKPSRRATRPTLERMEMLCKHMGDPQESVASIHITGTNGKTSTTRIAESLMRAKGLYTGRISSPHLQVMNERICLDGKGVTDEQLEHALNFVRTIEDSFDIVKESRPSYFEIFVAAAFELFHEEAIDVGVIEVGMGGLYDATNVCRSDVSVVTNVQLDHMMYLGDTREKIATEKSGIIKDGNRVVITEPDDHIAEIFLKAAQSHNGRAFRINEDFELLSNEQAVGGRLLSMRTPFATYRDVFLPLFGAHQGVNAITALVAAESFVDAALGEEVVMEGFSAARSPGRMEVMQHDPLVLIDGAHNIAGAQTLSLALNEDFGDARRIWVMGLTHEKDPDAMINALMIENEDVVIATAADSKRAMSTEDLSAALKNAGIETVLEISSAADAVDHARSIALDDDQVIVTGSLYVIGQVREHLGAE